MADILYLKRNDPAADCIRGLYNVSMILGELTSAIQLLRDSRAHLHQCKLVADIPWDVLESTIMDLSSVLQEFHNSMRGAYHPWDELPAG